jgi:hypothetical protein
MKNKIAAQQATRKALKLQIEEERAAQAPAEKVAVAQEAAPTAAKTAR